MERVRMEPFEAAKRFIADVFPNCDAALVAGSVVRGEQTATSDLDIVVFDANLEGAYRETFRMFGWPIEVFVHNFTSYHEFFKLDCDNARPSLPRMVTEGIVLVDASVLHTIKKEAKNLLEKGPAPWTETTLELKRYMLTDALDDLIGSTNKAEELFIVNALAEAVHEFYLRSKGQWIGASKWIVRALKQYDVEFANEFVAVFTSYYQTGDKEGVIALAEDVLEPYGGRLFEGFSMGKENTEQ